MAKDIIHDMVKNALIKDGWMITADPFTKAGSPEPNQSGFFFWPLTANLFTTYLKSL